MDSMKNKDSSDKKGFPSPARSTIVYTLLFTLSIIIINPWGSSRGEIWTQPKCAVLALIAICNLYLLWKSGETLHIPKSWFTSKLLWEIFLLIGFISTLLSPFPIRSLFGQDQMGDGWLYWLLIAAFTLSNTLVLKRYPQLLPAQLYGFLIGGILLALSTFPQLIDWRIDYTATTGQLLRDHILVSTIFQNHQPIGFYSHRGHAAFVLAALGVMAVACRQLRWVSLPTTVTIIIPIAIALFLANTRMALVAFIFGILYLSGRKYYRRLIPLILVVILMIGVMTTTRQISGLSGIKQMTSDRMYLWELATRGIGKRPLFGWGFNGFGIAYPYIRSPKDTPNVVRLGHLSYDVVSENGSLRTLPLITYKAHNLILDTILSVGILGMLSYTALWGYGIFLVVRSPNGKLLAVAIAYWVFTLTWFECAQFTHIACWTLSLGINTSSQPIEE
ncbi:O-antigen ligase family protein [Roseofilum reptotaenium CS-1145]|uniref:O-antigen ligase family protein n=1 Tax=Roseofilum reptotaenium TaxID=1233427 RepID=UPI000A8BE77E|nr:O-antigen ligase family protein [Roseofilum reptotaenium]MDB9518058.1 O-antigen ligase family protein [Roseofilum reptotaenium CS-1145]